LVWRFFALFALLALLTGPLSVVIFLFFPLLIFFVFFLPILYLYSNSIKKDEERKKKQPKEPEWYSSWKTIRTAMVAGYALFDKDSEIRKQGEKYIMEQDIRIWNWDSENRKGNY